MKSEPIIIQLQKEWFNEGYYVYIVKILNENNLQVYIGVTGDRKHKTARSPFYRMIGHFNRLNSSTENQIIRALKLSLLDGERIEDYLKTFDFTYYLYKILPFSPNPSNEHHKKCREEVERIESSLIQLFRDDPEVNKVINQTISLKTNRESFVQAKEIYQDFKNRK